MGETSQNKYVLNSSKMRIAIRLAPAMREAVIILAPGFFQSKETNTFLNLENDLRKYFDVLSMDFRGHGKSEGLYTFSAKEKEDLKAVVDYARERYTKVGVLGFSYGGTISMIEAAEYKNIDSLICVCAPMASEKIEFKWWTPEALKLGVKDFELGAGVRPGNLFLKKTRAIDIVQRISPTPILFMHGGRDPIVEFRHSQLLYEKAKTPKEIFIFKRGSHAEDIYRQFPGPFVKEVVKWFFKTLL